MACDALSRSLHSMYCGCIQAHLSLSLIIRMLLCMCVLGNTKPVLAFDCVVCLWATPTCLSWSNHLPVYVCLLLIVCSCCVVAALARSCLFPCFVYSRILCCPPVCIQDSTLSPFSPIDM